MKITIPLVLLVVMLGSMALTGCCTLTKSDRAKTIAVSLALVVAVAELRG